MTATRPVGLQDAGPLAYAVVFAAHALCLSGAGGLAPSCDILLTWESAVEANFAAR